MNDNNRHHADSEGARAYNSFSDIFEDIQKSIRESFKTNQNKSELMEDKL